MHNEDIDMSDSKGISRRDSLRNSALLEGGALLPASSSLLPQTGSTMNGIAPEVEIIRTDKVNEARTRVLHKAGRYRYVIDMKTP